MARRIVGTIFLGVGIAWLLAGCAEIEHALGLEEPTVATVPASTALVPKLKPAQPLMPKPKPGSAKTKTAEPQPAGSDSPGDPESAGAALVQDEIKGMDEVAVARLFGRPARTRTEGAGQVWSFVGAECALDVYFFLDVADNRQRVLSYEFISSTADAKAAEACYAKLKVN